MRFSLVFPQRGPEEQPTYSNHGYRITQCLTKDCNHQPCPSKPSKEKKANDAFDLTVSHATSLK